MAIDNDYDQPQYNGQVRRYWHVTRRCWVVAWVGEMVFGRNIASDPEALIEAAKEDFKPLGKGRRVSPLTGRVEEVLREHGPCDAGFIASLLNERPKTIARYCIDHPQSIARDGFHNRKMRFRLRQETDED